MKALVAGATHRVPVGWLEGAKPGATLSPSEGERQSCAVAEREGAKLQRRRRKVDMTCDADTQE
ncbi:MAG: hypothetical protein C5B57_02835 [Blastocatellia bacterium]|nr:MAG: hypothetical protein C5B57_02835 [Blastocatellia bacterium]